MTLPKYMSEFRKSERKKASLLTKDMGDLGRDPSAANAVVTTWQITFEQVHQERSSAADLLSLMSFFNPQGIPLWVLRNYQHMKHGDSSKADSAENHPCSDDGPEDPDSDNERFNDVTSNHHCAKIENSTLRMDYLC
jgi:hypothetical protein